MSPQRTSSLPHIGGSTGTGCTVEIVVPLFNEQDNVTVLHERLRSVCHSLQLPTKITYVNDGSVDDTRRLLTEIVDREPAVQVIELSRNFGHQAAIAAGLAHADGDAVVLLDGDLQDPPEVIPELVAAWQAGADVVVAQRTTRQESGWRRLAFALFHKTFKYLADCRIIPHTGTFSLMDRKVLDAVNQLGESHRFFPGLRTLVGFREAIVLYDRHERLHGAPKQSFRRLVRYAADGIFSFSFKPLRLLTFLGLTVMMAGIVTAGIFIGKRLLGLETAPMGFTTLACAVFAIGGIQIAAVGILGEYVGRIFEQVKQRPAYFVAEVKTHPANAQSRPTRQIRRAA